MKEYNDSIQNTSLVEEGYASFDMTMPEYDIDAIQDLWMKKNPDFIGYNCRITAFGLMKDLIMVQDMGGRNTEYLFWMRQRLMQESFYGRGKRKV